MPLNFPNEIIFYEKQINILRMHSVPVCLLIEHFKTLKKDKNYIKYWQLGIKRTY